MNADPEDENLLQYEQQPRLSNNSGSSRRSNFGQEMEFGQMRQNLTTDQVERIQCEFLNDILVLTLVMLMMRTGGPQGLAEMQTCGIPIRMWLNIFFALFGLRSCAQLFKIQVIRHFSEHVFKYDIAKVVFIDGFLIAWLVYGNALYYSQHNNCEKVAGTQYLNEFMSLVLFIGYFVMGIYAIILCTMPCLYMYIRRAEQEQMAYQNRVSIDQVPTILSSLSRVAYDPENFKHENTCAICLADYCKSDMVTQLRCNPNHYFHTECLEKWVNNQHNSCPLCREPIQNFEFDNENGSQIDMDR